MFFKILKYKKYLGIFAVTITTLGGVIIPRSSQKKIIGSEELLKPNSLITTNSNLDIVNNTKDITLPIPITSDENIEKESDVVKATQWRYQDGELDDYGKNCKSASLEKLIVLKNQWSEKIAIQPLQSAPVELYCILDSFGFDEVGALLKNEIIYGLKRSAYFENLNILGEPQISLKVLSKNHNPKVPISQFNLKNLKYIFTVENPGEIDKYILRNIKVKAKSKVEVEVNLEAGGMQFRVQPHESSMNPILSFSILAHTPHLFNVSLKTFSHKFLSKNYYQSFLNLQEFSFTQTFGKDWKLKVGTNKDNSISPSINDIHFFPTTTTETFRPELSTDLKTITVENIENDIFENFHTIPIIKTYSHYESLIQILQSLIKEAIPSGVGDNISILTKIFSECDFRHNLYNQGKFSQPIRNLFEGLIDSFKKNNNNKKQTNKCGIESYQNIQNEVEVFIHALIYQLKELRDSLVFEFKWISKPEISWTDSEKVEKSYSANLLKEFPKVSFNFENKISFKKSVAIRLKGGWDSDQKKVVDWKEESDRKQSSQVQYFDIANKITNFDVFFKLFMTSQTNSVITNLVGELKEFMQLDKLIIYKDEYIATRYKATDSKIGLSFSPNFSKWDNRNGQIVFGWKAMKTSINYDFTNFYGIFAQLFSKFECYKPVSEAEFSILNLINFNNVKNEIETSPIKKIMKIVNSLIGDGFKNDTDDKLKSCKQDDDASSSNVSVSATTETEEFHGKTWKEIEPKRRSNPWYILFGSLLKTHISFPSKTLTLSFSSLWYEKPFNWSESYAEILNEKENKSAVEGQQQQQQQQQQTDLQTDATSQNEWKTQIFNIKDVNKKYFDKQKQVEEKEEEKEEKEEEKQKGENNLIKSLKVRERGKEEYGNGEEFNVFENFLNPNTLKSESLKKYKSKNFLSPAFFYPNSVIIFPHPARIEDELKKIIDGEMKGDEIQNATQITKILNNTPDLHAKISEELFTYVASPADGTKTPEVRFTSINTPEIDVSIHSFNVASAIRALLSSKLNLGTIATTALSTQKIKVSEVLGNALQRDIMIALFSYKVEEGSYMFIKEGEFRIATYYSDAEFMTLLEPRFEKKGLQTGKISI